MPPSDHSRRRSRAERRLRARRRRRLQALALALVAAATAWIAFGAIGSGPRHAGSTAAEPRAKGSKGADEPSVVQARRPPPRPVIRFTVGRGVRSASVVRRAGSTGPRPVVIFFHGWGLVSPDAYGRWIRHLAALGNTVIVPRYQRDAGADPGRVRAAALAGVRRALERVDPAPRTVVVAGHSAGAALAADYAAVARSRRLPVPVAVFAVFPGRAIRGYPGGVPEADLTRISPSTWLTVLAGANDTVVGQAPARTMIDRTAQIPASRRKLILVAGRGAADHFAPTRSGDTPRRVFWRRLDRLIERARS